MSGLINYNLSLNTGYDEPPNKFDQKNQLLAELNTKKIQKELEEIDNIIIEKELEEINNIIQTLSQPKPEIVEEEENVIKYNEEEKQPEEDDLSLVYATMPIIADNSEEDNLSLVAEGKSTYSQGVPESKGYKPGEEPKNYTTIKPTKTRTTTFGNRIKATGSTALDTGSVVGKKILDTGSVVGKKALYTGSVVGKKALYTGSVVGSTALKTGISGVKATETVLRKGQDKLSKISISLPTTMPTITTFTTTKTINPITEHIESIIAKNDIPEIKMDLKDYIIQEEVKVEDKESYNQNMKRIIEIYNQFKKIYINKKNEEIWNNLDIVKKIKNYKIEE